MIDIPDSLFLKDPQGNSLCPKCLRVFQDCCCPELRALKPAQPHVHPDIRLERSGRKGKTVTIISNLPKDEKLLKALTKKLKTMTGAGGTFYFSENTGTIELQGDQRETVPELLRDFIC